MPLSSPVSVEASLPSLGDARYCAMVYASDRLHGKLTCRGLERQGFGCDFAYRPTDAQARLEAGKYDLILIDLRDSRADQVAVASAAFANRRRAKIMAIVGPGAGDVVKTLLACGVDEVVTETPDAETLALKALSLLEIEAWRQEAIRSQSNAPIGKLLDEIETLLLKRSAEVLRRIGDPFEPLDMPSSFRQALLTGAQRARQDRSGKIEEGPDRRRSERESVCLTASAIPLGEDAQVCGDPFAIVVGDVSMTGARLAHTRPVTAPWLALQWRCATVVGKAVTVEACVVRCETVGRFYEIGARFV